MLIRSQNREILTRFDTVQIDTYKSKEAGKEEVEVVNIVLINKSSIQIIGTYSTKEKAMRVLDEMEKTYADTLWTDRETIRANRVVFKMPQDDEVGKYGRINYQIQVVGRNEQ